MARRKRPNYEFKPDKAPKVLQKLLHLTALQRRQVLQWSLYGLLLVALLVLQDVIMSRVTIGGATTDLVPTRLTCLQV